MAAHRLPRSVCTAPDAVSKRVSLEFELALLMLFFLFLDNEKVVELLQAIKEKSITLDTIRHAPHPLCKSPSAHISGETYLLANTKTPS